MTFKEKPLLVTFSVVDFLSVSRILIYLSVLNLIIIYYYKKRKIKILILVDDVSPIFNSSVVKGWPEKHSNWFFMLCFLFIPAKECNLIRRPKTTTYLAASSCGNNSDLSSLYIHNHTEGNVPSLVDMGRIYRYKFQPANRIHSSEDEVALSWA